MSVTIEEPDMTDDKTPDVREAHDAETHPQLKSDPSHVDAKLDVALDESFPTSDAPSQTRPGDGEPAPSSGYDEEAERQILEDREAEAAGGLSITARFPTRRAADLAVEHLVQDMGIERTDIFVSADGADASSGETADGADVESGHPGVPAHKDPALGEAISVSIDLADQRDRDGIVSRLNDLGATSVETE
jgi:hypothetical protein